MDTIAEAVDIATERVYDQVHGPVSAVEAVRSLKQAFLELSAANTTSAADSADTLRDIQRQIQSAQKATTNAHRGVYQSLSRLGKAIERQFPNSIGDVAPLPETGGLDIAIVEHLLRDGRPDLAGQFAGDAGCGVSPELYESYGKLNSICKELEDGIIGSALDWALSMKDVLHKKRSALPFALHSAVFLRLAFARGVDCPNHLPRTEKRTNVSVALAYARERFPEYAQDHLDETQRLLALLVYLRPIEVGGNGEIIHEKDKVGKPEDLLRKVPPAYTNISGKVYDDHALATYFYGEFCHVEGLPETDPLRAAADLGANSAVGVITRAERIVPHRHAGWSRTDELPVEVPVPMSLERHSTFICPVSKEVASESNPPMLLSCGHVICRESLDRLVRLDKWAKCPYCPAEVRANEATRVYF